MMFIESIATDSDYPSLLRYPSDFLIYWQTFETSELFIKNIQRHNFLVHFFVSFGLPTLTQIFRFYSNIWVEYQRLRRLSLIYSFSHWPTRSPIELNWTAKKK